VIMAPQSSQPISPRGLLAGASTGIFWGLPFLAPQVLVGFTSLEIAFGRFFFFGGVSLLFIGSVRRVWNRLGTSDRWRLFLLSASGFWFYSMALFWAIQRTDGVVSSLILGLLPITIPLFGGGRVARGPRVLPGLLLILSGLLVLVLAPGMPKNGALKTHDAVGGSVLVLCLGMWTWYAIANGNFLKKHVGITAKELSSSMGVISLTFMIPLLLLFSNPIEMLSRPGAGAYLLIAAGLGIGSSWFANWLWNYCSARIPHSISGTLLVFETVFGLLYSFLFEKRWPLVHETVAIAFCLLGVVWSVVAQLARDPD
jgi:drug/metabolite transporter (DMT)-like permease